MITFEKEGLKIFEFEKLKSFKSLTHGVLTRKGGNSSSPYNSLNLNLDPKDNTEDILLNLEKIKKTLKLEDPVWAKQVHEDKIIALSSQNSSEYFECDGFVTSEPNIPILIKHADCQAALFYDPIKNIIGNIHCGWRGNVINIYKKTLEQMKTIYGCKPQDIIVCISPSLGPKHAQFMHYQRELPKSFWAFKIGDNHFDLWEVSKNQLIACGVLEKNIEIAKICTFESHDDFFSYRRERDTGRNLSYIELIK